MIDRSIYWLKFLQSFTISLSLSLSLSLSCFWFKILSHYASWTKFSLIKLHASSSFILPHSVGQNNVDSVCQGAKLLWNGKPGLSSHYNNILFVCKEVQSLSQQIMFFMKYRINPLKSWKERFISYTPTLIHTPRSCVCIVIFLKNSMSFLQW